MPASFLFASPIQDNSFLIEEAYNQEAGVVQHINTFAYDFDNEGWGYNFTQEWPVPDLRHQLSYSVPVLHEPSVGGGTGLGDVGLNYRYQLVGGPEAAWAVAPRLSVNFPTGDETDGLGRGSAALQTNLPVSWHWAPRFVAHGNAGLTWVPDDHEWEGFAGGSLIYLAHAEFNVMAELFWQVADGEHAVFINPGVRAAIDFANGLQIVPGLAMPIGMAEASGSVQLFTYLSFEHPLF